MSMLSNLRGFARSKTFVLGSIALAATFAGKEPVHRAVLEHVVKRDLGYTRASVVGERLEVRVDDDQCPAAFDHKYEVLARTPAGRNAVLVACHDGVGGILFAEIDPETRRPTTPFRHPLMAAPLEHQVQTSQSAPEVGRVAAAALHGI